MAFVMSYAYAQNGKGIVRHSHIFFINFQIVVLMPFSPRNICHLFKNREKEFSNYKIDICL